MENYDLFHKFTDTLDARCESSNHPNYRQEYLESLVFMLIHEVQGVAEYIRREQRLMEGSMTLREFDHKKQSIIQENI